MAMPGVGMTMMSLPLASARIWWTWVAFIIGVYMCDICFHYMAFQFCWIVVIWRITKILKYWVNGFCHQKAFIFSGEGRRSKEPVTHGFDKNDLGQFLWKLSFQQWLQEERLQNWQNNRITKLVKNLINFTLN